MKSQTNSSDKAINVRQTAREQIEGIMGKGNAIRSLFNLVELYAKQDCPILFEGETGVGKKEIVNYLHAISPRSRKKLVTIDCGTLSESLIEPELFGCKKGAYTDAKTDRIGQIETANGSTLFLDNINYLPTSMQHKLLHVIEDQRFTKVGDNKPTEIDVRIVAAGNGDFKDLIEKNRFLINLSERFVEIIKVPNLTVRKDDMDFFIDKFLKEKAKELGKKGLRTDAKTRNLIKEHTWKNNVRQLKNFIHRIVTRVEDRENTKSQIIPFELVKACLADEMVTGKQKEEAFDNDFTMETALNKARKKAIERALERSLGNNEEAIALLGIARDTYFKWKK